MIEDRLHVCNLQSSCSRVTTRPRYIVKRPGARAIELSNVKVRREVTVPLRLYVACGHVGVVAARGPRRVCSLYTLL